MCRHLAHLGPPITLESLVLAAPHSLQDQARHARFQRDGSRNADGFGIGWYDRSIRPEPARHRTAKPIWDDASFASFAGLVRSSAIVAAVRHASPGMPIEESGSAPFTADEWLFSLNGFVVDFHEGVGDELRSRVSERRLSGIEGVTDSEVLFGLVLDQLDAGASPADALAHTVKLAEDVSTGRLNLLLSDGERVVATAVGNSLFELDGTIVASEPLDDRPGWKQLPDRSLVELGPAGPTCTTL